MAFLLLANSNPEVNENQKMELMIGSLSFNVRPSGSTCLSDPGESGPSVSKAKTITLSGSSVGSSSKVNSLVSFAATENTKKELEKLDGTQEEPDEGVTVDKSYNSQRDLATESSGISRSIYQLCVIITEAAEENGYEDNAEIDTQVDKSRINGKKEKEKIHVSNGEWRIIMSAINHGTEVPANSRREVLMGYQYALHQHSKKLREEKYELRRSQENYSMSSGAYWDKYNDELESSRERNRDPKHSRRTTAWAREESHVKSVSKHPSDNEKDFVQETPEVALVAAQAYLLTTQPEPGDPRDHMGRPSQGQTSESSGDKKGKAQREDARNIIAQARVNNARYAWDEENYEENYALPKGFAERGYPKDSNCHTISKSMMGHKNPRCGYQTTYKRCKYSEEQEQRQCKAYSYTSPAQHGPG
jgi:hypothetical protein